jgi:hypothetical protein
MIDTRNTRDLDNHRVWIPFHFLPGNGGLPRGRKPPGRAVERLICTRDSPIARDMVRQAIIEQHRPYGLHRLGVTLHVYADTWAHQGFAGLLDNVNEVDDVEETGNSGVFASGLDDFLMNVLDKAIPPLGHGRATILPDMPFLQWSYRDSNGRLVRRNNIEDFYTAADEMCKAMQRYLLGDPNAAVDGLGPEDGEKIHTLLARTLDKDGNDRHRVWLDQIRNGLFSFGPEETCYMGKLLGGCSTAGSWKTQALGTPFDRFKYTYKASFLKSNWKLFHDAVMAHRLYVVDELLPAYGICAA